MITSAAAGADADGAPSGTPSAKRQEVGNAPSPARRSTSPSPPRASRTLSIVAAACLLAAAAAKLADGPVPSEQGVASFRAENPQLCDGWLLPLYATSPTALLIWSRFSDTSESLAEFSSPIKEVCVC